MFLVCCFFVGFFPPKAVFLGLFLEWYVFHQLTLAEPLEGGWRLTVEDLATKHPKPRGAFCDGQLAGCWRGWSDL